MLITVFTPTNNLTYLDAAWQSLKHQTHKDWEWVLIPNGEISSLPADITEDPRVRIFTMPEGAGNIGALKRFACQHGRGELFVELDHDDILAHNCLERLAKTADPLRPQFLYSDFASVTADLKPVVYGAKFGWETYNTLVNNRLFQAHRSFDVCPMALTCLQLSPNHVRAWTRVGYLHAGGYSDEFPIADDYDLIVRSYLKGLDFIHIPECLYIYRTYDTASSRQQQPRLAEIQQKISNANMDAITLEWCRRHDYPAIEMAIATGQASKLPIIHPLAGVELREGQYWFPGLSDLEESSIGKLLCRNMLPYLDRPLIIPFFEACYRALVPGGWLQCIVPSTTGPGAFANPLYRSYWNTVTFRTFTVREMADLAGGHKCRFQYARGWETWHDDIEYQLGLRYAYVDLVAVKGQKQPGLLEI